MFAKVFICHYLTTYAGPNIWDIKVVYGLFWIRLQCSSCRILYVIFGFMVELHKCYKVIFSALLGSFAMQKQRSLLCIKAMCSVAFSGFNDCLKSRIGHSIEMFGEAFPPS